MLAITGIVLSLVLLMYLAYRGINVLVLAPALALFAVLFSGESGTLLGTYTQVFMQSLGNYVVKYFPLFMLGAIFGKLMDDSGSARAIAHWLVRRLGSERSILTIVLACGILTYGGVSLFVVGFAVYPIAAALFREADMPKRLIPGAIALGALTFTMTALPGTPAIQNAIPMPFFGTDAFAAPVLGILGGGVMLLGGMFWLNHRASLARVAGEGFGSHVDEARIEEATGSGPGIALALLPIVLVILGNFAFTKYLIPALDHGYLAQPKFGATDLGAVLGIWSIICALALACLVLIAANWRRWTNLRDTLNKGTLGSLLPIFNTASEVGYGSVIASLGAFVVVRDFLVGLSPNNPLISEAILVNALAGITGSASGGMSIALNTMGQTYLQLANQFGIAPELLHRVASIASGGLDALPHNGAVISLLAICGLTHRQSYSDIFVVAVAIPLLALALVIALGTAFGAF
ncbi:integral membrane permease/GntP family/citrate transporter [Azotobacter vinelandii CA]|uniref:Integral membrane permease/GntP family/citrate transporter n=2 Tax=Azotobacter vinelandii TaxID=354 RepID=C1DQT5_AZOVD|nr:GntP family permease [Azotobacter vinelandii]ACO77608.1 integral membrane permease/GntP family/citrate transporter [Azotobacter vinelandii DJ]AGK17012.1 integral membrane permease/GntP family/citrate transporter [Azotobacter vinelandii CA]AGK19883.1 integral membrane permease/GntP family/citrate transporter [Azotobacter vinelandii CA6]WKN23383.1 GntP family permease [Azotobacter vinelandii]SFX98355.1 H+/gluconate symporter [Azotobacter vinelandii]